MRKLQTIVPKVWSGRYDKAPLSEQWLLLSRCRILTKKVFFVGNVANETIVQDWINELVGFLVDPNATMIKSDNVQVWLYEHIALSYFGIKAT